MTNTEKSENMDKETHFYSVICKNEQAIVHKRMLLAKRLIERDFSKVRGDASKQRNSLKEIEYHIMKVKQLLG